MSITEDTQFRSVTIAAVEPVNDGWSCTDSDGWSLYVPSDLCSTPPHPGETMRQYGHGFGAVVRGIVIGGRVYRYRTEAEEQARHEAEVARRKLDQSAQYESARAEYDARVAALAGPLKARIERFRRVGGDDWRSEFEPYELFVCEQAAAIAQAHQDGRVPDLVAFNELPFDEQRALVPQISDDHSGNTFGAAMMLARILSEQPELTPKAHGALCPLVGCKSYGCFAATRSE